MRAPDKEALVDRKSAALLWVEAADAAATVIVDLFGVEVTPGRSAPALADSELVVKCWNLRKPEKLARPDYNAHIAGWIINGPYHPFWRWWNLSIVHLRDIPGVEPAHVQFPGATHEVIIATINPERCSKPDIDALERGTVQLPFLSPMDLVHQVILVSDEQAAELAELMINAILSGDYSPDSDFRGRWKSILDRTAEHLRLGGHPG